MYRRNFLQGLVGSGLAFGFPFGKTHAQNAIDYQGRFFVTLQAEGAWDVASFCDPKINQPGEPTINQWSQDGGIERRGNLRYAPYASNEAFFKKYYKDMLVVNGIDAQTNSHTTGVVHNWSGRNSAGYPSLTALFSAVHGSHLPLSYLNFGGYSETAKLVRYTKLNDLDAVLAVLTPNTRSWDRARTHQRMDNLELIKGFQQNKLAYMQGDNSILPHHRYTMESYFDARDKGGSLQAFASMIPTGEDRQSVVTLSSGYRSALLQQMQSTLLAFRSNAACSADLVLSGFDTHADHELNHEPLLGHLTDAIDFFWEYAASLGIAHRITLLVASDFGRTPFYNANDGKDHWSIGSALVMEKNARWGNRLVGGTTELLHAKNINASTLAVQERGGTRIYPKHLHSALREYLGISHHEVAQRFPFDLDERIGFFDA